MILLVWSANGTDFSRTMFPKVSYVVLLFVILVQVYVRIFYDCFLKESASFLSTRNVTNGAISGYSSNNLSIN